MERHLSPRELSLLMNGGGENAAPLHRHIGNCEHCSDRLGELARLFRRFQSAQGAEPVWEEASCPWSRQVAEYARGRGDPAVFVQMEEHLLECEICRDVFELSLDREIGPVTQNAAERRQTAMGRIHGFYTASSLPSLPLLLCPGAALRDGQEDSSKRYMVEGGQGIPNIAIIHCYDRRGALQHYLLDVAKPGADIDLFDVDGNLLASFCRLCGTLQVSSESTYFVVNGKHAIAL